jgi:hypothetical protein
MGKGRATETERMPSSLLLRNRSGPSPSKLKICNRFSKPNSEPLPKPRRVRQVRGVFLDEIHIGAECKGGLAQGLFVSHADVYGIVEHVSGDKIESDKLIAHIHVAVVVDPFRLHFSVSSE